MLTRIERERGDTGLPFAIRRTRRSRGTGYVDVAYDVQGANGRSDRVCAHDTGRITYPRVGNPSYPDVFPGRHLRRDWTELDDIDLSACRSAGRVWMVSRMLNS